MKIFWLLATFVTMIIVYPNINKTLERKFPYPRLMNDYTREEYMRLTKLSNIWNVICIISVVLLLIMLTFAFAGLFYLLNGALVSIVHSGPGFYKESWPPFLLPGVIIAFPASFLLSYWLIYVFNRKDYGAILDFLNVRIKFDIMAGCKWMMKAFLPLWLIADIFISWAYVTVSPNGFDIKPVSSFTVQHYNYSGITAIVHYRYYFSYNSDPIPSDHYNIYFNNGHSFSYIAPSIDDKNKCAEEIIKNSGMRVIEDSIDHTNN